MDLNLQAVSATVVLGAYFSIGLLALFRAFFGVPRGVSSSAFARLKGSLGERLSGLTTTALLLTLFFGVGILVEDLSNKYVDLPDTRWTDFKLLQSESHLRSVALFGDLQDGDVFALGKKWASMHLLDRYGGQHGPVVAEAIRAGRLDELRDLERESREAASEAYYQAKNILYGKPTYHEELKAIQQRIDFTRSLALLTLVLMIVGVFLALLEVSFPGKIGGCFIAWRKRVDGRTPSIRTCSRSLGRPTARRRKCSQRALAALVPILLIYLCARTAYAHEEREFDLRTFGYFASLETDDAPTPAELNLPDISGLAYLGDEKSLLVVHDTKRQDEAPNEDRGRRVGILEIHPDGHSPALRYRPVHVRWRGHAVSNDLEGACPVPGRPREALVVESSAREGRAARILHLSVGWNGSDAWHGTVERALELPSGRRDLENIEGIACAPAPEGKVLVLLCDRSSGTVWSATISSDPHALDPLGPARRGVARAPEGIWREPSKVRACSDLYADRDGVVWASAAEDPNIDSGPFRSALYRAGQIEHGRFVAATEEDRGRAVALLEGFKIEAVGPGVAKGQDLSVATDDEDYGGTWRPICLTGGRECGATSDTANESFDDGDGAS